MAATVLIVEDNFDLSTLFQMVLGLDQIDAEVCRDGRTALQQIQATRPRVIILDMHLPHVSGEEIFAYVQENHPESTVLIVTADMELFGKYSLLHPRKTFQKPMEMDLFRAEVRAALKE